MGEIDLATRFPEMDQSKCSPTLFRFNGIGCTFHGERDRDPATQTYVATHWFTLIWVPLFAIGAYRVSRAGAGWYVLGKVPTSTAVRVFSRVTILGIAALLGGAFWSQHTNSPDYRAEKNLARADECVASGELGEAAALYRDVMQSGTKHGRIAREGFKRMLDGPVRAAPLEQATRVFRVAVGIQQSALAKPIAPDLALRGLALVRTHTKDDPQSALLMLEVLEPLGDEPEAVAAARLPLLEALVKMNPEDLRRVVELADLYTRTQRLEESVALLEPHRATLGGGEGARVLGQAYLGLERPEDALPLLEAYAEVRVSKLAPAQKAYGELIDRLWAHQIDLLNQGRADPAFYAHYERVSQAKKDALVSQHVGGILEDDPRVQKAREKLATARRVIPVVLDLGIAKLHRAQGIADESERRQQLVAAEQAFLSVSESISEAGGESDAYRLYMAQVQYWLGRSEKGKDLFETFLASHKRSAAALIEVAGTLRLLGASVEARKLAEEAHGSPGVERAVREAAASMRSLCAIDEDDALLWLRRSDKTQPHIASRWKRAEGRRALREGRQKEAEKFFRESIDAFSGLPESDGTLNDIADSYLALFELNGDVEEFKRALKFTERAVTLSPNDSILLGNAATLTLEGVILDVLDDALDLRALPIRGELSLLSYLYADEAERERVWARMRAHPGFDAAIQRFEQLLVLAPRSTSLYSTLGGLYGSLRDADALRSLLSKMQAAGLDPEEGMEETRRYWRDGAKEGDRKRLREYAAKMRKTLEALRVDGTATTRAVAGGLLVDVLTSAHTAGMEVDAAEVVRLAEEAYEARPSTATAASLHVALVLRADRALRAVSPEYVQLTAGLLHALSTSDFVALALEQPGTIRTAALALDDVKRLAALLQAGSKAFPKSASPIEWILMRALAPAQLPAYTAVLRARPDVAAAIEYWLAFAPHSAGTLLQGYWLKLALGYPLGAKRLLAAGRAAGVPLPKR